ncbi:dihydropteroate synthase [Aureimonas jatrophae]|uniref:dihydropteroate synthase n=2 Tax=Aureimonas jatrophae TaxID=1166073 RepID=A0A1H0GII1_9HYPH|nr:dihydropteroate synthase [Aureimonas jatrophae]SDO06688.1 Dihydropteroate synthase [Aureimonas jatrophae]
MGILNCTPDSFSDGGRYGENVDDAVAAGLRMVADGASIIDVGGESTRPGADPVSAEVEQARILPVISALACASDCLISVDTYRAQTAQRAVAAGAHIVNDVWGAQREPLIAEVAARTGAGLCLMHTGRERETDSDPIRDQFAFLRRSLDIARAAGVADEAIVLDPGFGFAKDAATNFALMRRFRELRALGRPFLVGTSRKRFVRAAVGEAGDQDRATAATTALLRVAGASIFRVHDVAANREALRIADATMRSDTGSQG